MLPKKILYCTDFSENSAPAGECASEYSNTFGADLTILHVVDCWAGFPGNRQDVLEIARKLEDSANKQLGTLARDLGKNGVQTKTLCTIGLPAEEIVLAAQREHADLIVMGTHGWTGFRHLMLGSEAEKVLRTATCPVLVVRPVEDSSDWEMLAGAS